MLVIDEADEMLNKGFKEQIYDIYRYLPPSTQVVLISATMPQEVLDMTKKFMNMPVKILVKRDELTLEGIKQVRSDVKRNSVFCAPNAMRGESLKHNVQPLVLNFARDGNFPGGPRQRFNLYSKLWPRQDDKFQENAQGTSIQLHHNFAVYTRVAVHPSRLFENVT